MGAFVDCFRPKSFTPRYPRWMVGRPLLITSSALASLGDAMFGYSQGVIAALQVQPPFIRRFFGQNITMEQITTGDTGVDPYVQAITVACLNITAFISALCAAYICDVLGRRMSVRIGGLVYLVAAIIQILSPNLTSLIVGRSLQGIGVGILSMTVPILQCEIAPGHSRGLFISIEYLCLNLGYALSSWIGFGFFFTLPSEISWKGPYIIQAALALILVLWSFVLPETPRFLIKNGFLDEGLRVLADLHTNGDIDDPRVLVTHAEIRMAIKLEESLGEASWGQVFTQYKRRTVVGITCQVFAQFNGINAILYFLPSNLLRAGFTIEQSLLYAAGVSLVYCAGTLPTMFGIDRLGRRPLGVVSYDDSPTDSVGDSKAIRGCRIPRESQVYFDHPSFTLVVALCIVGGLQFYVESLPQGNARMPGADGIFAAVCLYLFIYGATWGPGPWLLGAEIYPMRARAKGMALSTTANWISNFIIAFVTPPLFATIVGGYYFLLAGFCTVSGIFVYFFYPETAHKTLEELGSVFNDQAPREEEVEKFPGALLAVPGTTTRDDSTSDQTLRGSISSSVVKKESASAIE